jgi:transposase
VFIRKNKNRSGSVSIQIIQKVGRQNKVVKTVGCAKTKREEDLLYKLALNEMEQIQGLQSLFVEHDDQVVDSFVDSIETDHLHIAGSELILGKIYHQMGYPDDEKRNLFRNLVLCRLVYPGSKYKTVEYFKRHLNLDISVYTVYRYLDHLHFRGKIGVVFYDMTTLYFEASEEDDFRIPGYSKDGKNRHPQVLIGLLVGSHGYPIGYELFEGNTSETKTLIPVLESFQERFDLEKPIVIADAALLSQKNIDALTASGYEYVLGGRLKNESEEIKTKVLEKQIQEGHPIQLQHPNGRLVVSYSAKRAHNDRENRRKGLQRLEKRVKSGKLSKKHINNRGYNKYLKLIGDITITIDYEKYNADSIWDGLKGYITNTTLTKNQVIENYMHLWQIEKAFRISKTDLRIRPVYHRIRHRIEAHICICFVAYAVYKELERLLLINNIGISAEKAINEIKEIRKLQYRLPRSGVVKTKLLRLNEIQTLLTKMKI